MEPPSQSNPVNESDPASAYSLRELVDLITGRSLNLSTQFETSESSGGSLFPFMALVGQQEMRTALLLILVNPLIGGILLIGPQGTGKSTAVRSLASLMPVHRASTCHYGCLPEDIETGGMDAVCPECARKYGEGLSLTHIEPAHLIELPQNPSFEDIFGQAEDPNFPSNNLPTKRSLLSQADQNFLFIKDINLVNQNITRTILNAASTGVYNIRRGTLSTSYKSRISVIASMDPQAGLLNPELLSQFGLRVLVKGLDSEAQRIEAYQRAVAFQKNPSAFVGQFFEATETARKEVQAARDRLPSVEIPEKIMRQSVHLLQAQKVASLRAQIALLQGSLALAAVDGRFRVELDDIKYIAPMVIRLRQSPFADKFFEYCSQEDLLINKSLNDILD